MTTVPPWTAAIPSNVVIVRPPPRRSPASAAKSHSYSSGSSITSAAPLATSMCAPEVTERRGCAMRRRSAAATASPCGPPSRSSARPAARGPRRSSPTSLTWIGAPFSVAPPPARARRSARRARAPSPRPARTRRGPAARSGSPRSGRRARSSAVAVDRVHDPDPARGACDAAFLLADGSRSSGNAAASSRRIIRSIARSASVTSVRSGLRVTSSVVPRNRPSAIPAARSASSWAKASSCSNIVVGSLPRTADAYRRAVPATVAPDLG